METQITSNELLLRILDRIDQIDQRIMNFEKKVDNIYAEQKALREEQRVINNKMDGRVTNLEMWRNTYK